MNIDSIIKDACQENADKAEVYSILDDPVAFAKKYFRWDLYESQRGWWDLARKRKKLMINSSVDCGKSGFFGFVYPIMEICRNPNINILFASSSYDAIARPTIKRIRDQLKTNRKLIEDFGPFYSYENDWSKKYFTVIRSNTTDRDYTMYGAGVGMGIEGAKFDLIILDDIIDRKATFSAAYRKDAVDWFNSTLRQRMVKGTQLIVIGSLWHPDDIYAYLKKKGYRPVRQPAINENGELLCPERHTREYLDDIAADILDEDSGGDWFELRYMVNPRAISGNQLDPAWLQFYEKNQLPRLLRTIQVIDPSGGGKKGHYYAKLTLGLGENKNIYALDMTYKRLLFPERMKDIRKGIEEWDPYRCVIESNMDKGSMYQSYCDKYPEDRFRMKSSTETRNKHAKIQASGRFYEAGMIYLLRSMRPFVKEFSNFPSGNDDLLDCMCMGIDELIGKIKAGRGSRVAGYDRPRPSSTLEPLDLLQRRERLEAQQKKPGKRKSRVGAW